VNWLYLGEWKESSSHHHKKKSGKRGDNNYCNRRFGLSKVSLFYGLFAIATKSIRLASYRHFSSSIPWPAAPSLLRRVQPRILVYFSLRTRRRYSGLMCDSILTIIGSRGMIYRCWIFVVMILLPECIVWAWFIRRGCLWQLTGQVPGPVNMYASLSGQE
jgi:hypothetical protein